MESDASGTCTSYALRVVGERADGSRFEESFAGPPFAFDWEVRHFAWTADPREDLEGWRSEAENAVVWSADRLELAFGGDGPSRFTEADLPVDRFGTIARSSIDLPAGEYEITTVSDDGVRVVVDGETVIEDWTWHGARRHTARIAVDRLEKTHVELLVEHFELDGAAVLEFRIERVE